MFSFNLKEIFSFFQSCTYSMLKNQTLEYSLAPRPFYNLVVMKKGCAQIVSSGKTIEFKRGDVLFIPKNTTYKWICEQDVDFHTVHFCFQNKCDPFKSKVMPVQLLSNENFNELVYLFEQTENKEDAVEEYTFSTVSAFFKVLEILLPSVKTLPQKPTAKVLLPAINYIESNYFKPITVEYLASLCFLSPSRFYYVFKETTGFSPIVYKNQIAVANASNDLLLNQDESILSIANAHGFTNLIYFERLFKKITGQSPSKYRKTKLFL